MTDRLKMVKIRARNVPRKQTQAPRRRLESADVPRCCPVETLKKISPDNLHVSGSCLRARKLSRQYALFTLTPNLSNLIITIASDR